MKPITEGEASDAHEIIQDICDLINQEFGSDDRLAGVIVTVTLSNGVTGSSGACWLNDLRDAQHELTRRVDEVVRELWVSDEGKVVPRV